VRKFFVSPLIEVDFSVAHELSCAVFSHYLHERFVIQREPELAWV